MLGLLRGEPEQRAHGVGVAVKLRARVIEHERHDELLDEAERVQIADGRGSGSAPAARAGSGNVQRLDARERLRHERLREVERLVAADQVLDAPVDALRRCQGSSGTSSRDSSSPISFGCAIVAPRDLSAVVPPTRFHDCSRDATTRASDLDDLRRTDETDDSSSGLSDIRRFSSSSGDVPEPAAPREAVRCPP